MSAKDPIEELFRDNQHGLDEQPRGLIWDRIEEKLEENPQVSQKNTWWKYAAAACLVAGLSFASYIFLYDSNPPAQQNNEAEIVHQPMEINEENASEILDKIEEEKQSIVTTQKIKAVPEIYMPMETKSDMKIEALPEIYDYAPVAAPIYEPIPQMTDAKEMEAQESEKMEDMSIVFRGETPEKKGKNVITQKSASTTTIRDEDIRRMGNSAESSIMYESADVSMNQISVPVKNSLIQYNLVSQTDSSVTFRNENVNYPNQIIITNANDSVRVIYSGKENKKNSKESKEIQNFLKENKSQIASDFGLK